MKYLFFFLFLSAAQAQTTFHDEQFGFTVQEPKDWIKAEKNEAVENVKERIKLSEEKLNELLKNNKGTIEIVTFYKYPVSSVNGVIPTIKVNLRKNPAKSIEDFKRMMEYSIGDIKKVFPKMTITKAPSIVQLDGKSAVYFESLNVIPTKNGEEEVRTLTYAVPVGTNFYQINFMDVKKDNCEKVFNETINSIQL